MKYLLLSALIFQIIGMLAQIHLLYYLTYLFAGLYFILKFYQYYLNNYLEIKHQVFDNYIFLNEFSKGEVKFINKGILPIIWLQVIHKFPRELYSVSKKKIISLKAYQTKKWKFKLKGKQRGYFKLGNISWKTGDLFGFFSCSGSLQENET